MEKNRSRLASLWIHPQIERSVVFHRETAHWIVELHGRDSEVGQDNVDSVDSQLHKELRQSGKIGPVRSEAGWIEAEQTKARLCFREFNWVQIKT